MIKIKLGEIIIKKIKNSNISNIGKIRNIWGGELLLKDCDDLIQVRIIYWGPDSSGKTTIFKRIVKRFQFERLGKVLSIKNSKNQTLLQDEVNIAFKFNIDEINYGLRCNILTLPGSEPYVRLRDSIIRGADGVIFVADAQPEKLNQNIQSFQELMTYVNPNETPVLIQLNKSDITDSITLDALKQAFRIESYSSKFLLKIYKTSAINKDDNCILCFLDLLFLILLDKIRDDDNSIYKYPSIDMGEEMYLKFSEKQDPEEIYDIINDRYELEKYNGFESTYGLDRYNPRIEYTLQDKKVLKQIIEQNERDYHNLLPNNNSESAKILKDFKNALIFMFGFEIRANGIGRAFFREDVALANLYSSKISLENEWNFRTKLIEAERRLLNKILKKFKSILEMDGIEAQISY